MNTSVNLKGSNDESSGHKCSALNGKLSLCKHTLAFAPELSKE